MKGNYLFISERLGFRNWIEEDIPEMWEICSDPQVMQFFPRTLSLDQTSKFVHRMQVCFAEKGYCYFAVVRLDTDQLIGFIGIFDQDYEADFTPCIDIGWRLSAKEWGSGLATEGAKRCLAYAFNQLNINRIMSICPVVNTKSQRVMQKIGMVEKEKFSHSLLRQYPDLELCVRYEIISKEEIDNTGL